VLRGEGRGKEGERESNSKCLPLKEGGGERRGEGVRGEQRRERDWKEETRGSYSKVLRGIDAPASHVPTDGGVYVW